MSDSFEVPGSAGEWQVLVCSGKTTQKSARREAGPRMGFWGWRGSQAIVLGLTGRTSPQILLPQVSPEPLCTGGLTWAEAVEEGGALTEENGGKRGPQRKVGQIPGIEGRQSPLPAHFLLFFIPFCSLLLVHSLLPTLSPLSLPRPFASFLLSCPPSSSSAPLFLSPPLGSSFPPS